MRGERRKKRRNSRVSEEESFARLLFYGVSLLHRPEREVWLMPFGALLDQWEVYRQFNGLAKPLGAVSIDDVIPEGI